MEFHASQWPEIHAAQVVDAGVCGAAAVALVVILVAAAKHHIR